MKLPKHFAFTYVFVSMLFFAVFSGCEQMNNTESAVSNSECDPVVAVVNGRELHRQMLLEVLLPSRGRAVLDNLILLELARDHARAQGVNFNDQMVRDELDRVLNDMAADQPELQRSELLNYMLASRGLSRNEFDVMLETRALLRSCVDHSVVITEQQLQQEYDIQYGRAVVVRIITMGNLREVEAVQRRVNAGESFANLVQQYSEDPVSLANNGLLGPFSRYDEQIDEPIRAAAFELTYIGQISPVVSHRQGSRQWWSLIELADAQDAQPVTLGQVSDELVEILRERTINQRMTILAQQLRDNAEVRIIDPLLRR
ncbi:MAG: peptidylprolyl isomerase [Sedimentisphaerales bacterium]|nr:peptidylprolyl isomerase [Sedimentisphaerales bacterium]